jgi:hypothetical protein
MGRGVRETKRSSAREDVASGAIVIVVLARTVVMRRGRIEVWEEIRQLENWAVLIGWKHSLKMESISSLVLCTCMQIKWNNTFSC